MILCEREIFVCFKMCIQSYAVCTLVWFYMIMLLSYVQSFSRLGTYFWVDLVILHSFTTSLCPKWFTFFVMHAHISGGNFGFMFSLKDTLNVGKSQGLMGLIVDLVCRLSYSRSTVHTCIHLSMYFDLCWITCLLSSLVKLQTNIFTSVSVSVCLCVGTVWQGCQGTTRRRTSAAQRPTTVCWKIWSSGHNTRSRWLPTLEPVWASTAALSRSTLCREVSNDTQTLYFLVLVDKADVPRTFETLCQSSVHAHTHITEFKVFPHEHVSSIIFQCTLF